MKPFPNLTSLALVLGAGILVSGLTGCYPIMDDQRVVLIDPAIGGVLELESRDPRWNDVGQLEARATMRNLTADPLHVLVQTVFLDAEGAPLQGNPSWENVVVPAYGAWNHSRTAIDTRAVDFRIEIREGVQH